MAGFSLVKLIVKCTLRGERNWMPACFASILILSYLIACHYLPVRVVGMPFLFCELLCCCSLLPCNIGAGDTTREDKSN